MVKQFISLVALFVMTVATVNAQNEETEFGKNEFQVNAGAGIMTYEKNDFGKFAIDKIDYSDEMLAYCNIGVGYMHNLTMRFGLGIDFAAGLGMADLENFYKKNVGVIYQITGSVLGTARFYWFRKHHVSLYTKAGVGVETFKKGVLLKDWYKRENPVDDEDLRGDTGKEFAYSINPVGVDFGGMKVRGFVEPQITNHRVTLNAGARFFFQ